MKKWLKNKQCAYCVVNPATTEEHIFAVGFFHEADRDNHPLPKAPACAECNGKKSVFDEYAMTVLSFGGRHPSALPNLETKGGRRLQKNDALRKRLRRGVGRAWIQEPSGIIQSTTTFPVDSGKLVSLFQYIAKGLMWHHWGVYVSPETTISVLFHNEEGAEGFKQQFAQWRWQGVRGNLRSETVLYEGKEKGSGSVSGGNGT